MLQHQVDAQLGDRILIIQKQNLGPSTHERLLTTVQYPLMVMIQVFQDVMLC